MKDLPKSQRPRERLEAVGPQNLSLAELIAIILGTGTKQQNVLTLAHRVVRTIQSHPTDNLTISDLSKLKGLGSIQAGKLIAALELGTRFTSQLSTSKITSPQDVINATQQLNRKSREHLLGLYLDARHRLIKKYTLAIGSLNQTILEPRDVFNQALRLPCTSLILVHNHPSGNPQPSQDDKVLTQHIQQAGTLLGITLTDHIIIAKDDYFSFKESGLLQ